MSDLWENSLGNMQRENYVTLSSCRQLQKKTLISASLTLTMLPYYYVFIFFPLEDVLIVEAAV